MAKRMHQSSSRYLGKRQTTLFMGGIGEAGHKRVKGVEEAVEECDNRATWRSFCLGLPF